MKKKTLYWSLILILIFSLAYAGISVYNDRIRHDKHVTFLTESSKKGRTVIKSELKTPYKLVVTLNGSFNDTILFDAKKIPPSDIDKIIYDSDWYADSAWFYFDAYKATKVDLEVAFCFYQ